MWQGVPTTVCRPRHDNAPLPPHGRAPGPIANGKAPSDRVRAPRRRDTPPANRSIPSQARTIAEGEICPSRAGFWPLLNTLFASLNHEAACSFSIKSVTGFPSSHAWRSLSVSTFSPEADLRWRSFAAFFQPSANLRLPAFPPLPSSGLKKSRAAGTMCASSLLTSLVQQLPEPARRGHCSSPSSPPFAPTARQVRSPSRFDCERRRPALDRVRRQMRVRQQGMESHHATPDGRQAIVGSPQGANPAWRGNSQGLSADPWNRNDRQAKS